jgi:hypothetical protein
LEYVGIDGRIMVKWILNKYNGGYGSVAGSFEHGNKLPGFIKGLGFLDYQNDY